MDKNNQNLQWIWGQPAVRICFVIFLIMVGWTFGGRLEAAEGPSEVNNATLGDYRLAPGDRLAIHIFDQEQLSGDFLSGDFFVDGSGGILLPLAGTIQVAGLTISEAQQLIQERLADGIMVHPAVSVRLPEFRPIFVSGFVKNPGRYPFTFGQTVKTAIATAGGEGQTTEQLQSVVMSDFITADQSVRQLEMNRLSLQVRKARLEAQRDERANFVMPQLVGFNSSSVDFQPVYTAEQNAFLLLAKTYHDQLQTLEQQRPRLEEQMAAVAAEIATEKGHLDIVNQRLDDLEHLFAKGLLRKELLINQRIEKALVQAGLSRLQAAAAQAQVNIGELDVKIGDVKASYVRQTLAELQETSQRLREIDAIIGSSRKLRDIKAEYANIITGQSDESSNEPDYTIVVSRTSESGIASFNATIDTTLQPGDVVEVKLKRDPSNWRLPSQVTDLLENKQFGASSAEGLTLGSNPPGGLALGSTP